MKKILLSLLAMFTIAAHADNSTIIWKSLPLLTGYNALITATNGQTATGLGTTNVLFTAYNSQVLYSYSNNPTFVASNGAPLILTQTNIYAPDAFQVQHFAPDQNGDFNSNAWLVVITGNTNWIPQQSGWFTNSFGQVIDTNWLLAVSQFPNWSQPVTPNTYTPVPASASNVLFVSLFPTPGGNPQGGGYGSVIGPKLSPLLMGASTAATTISETIPSGAPNVAFFQLPASAFSAGKDVYMSAFYSNIAGIVTSPGVLVNQIFIIQPQ